MADHHLAVRDDGDREDAGHAVQLRVAAGLLEDAFAGDRDAFMRMLKTLVLSNNERSRAPLRAMKEQGRRPKGGVRAPRVAGAMFTFFPACWLKLRSSSALSVTG